MWRKTLQTWYVSVSLPYNKQLWWQICSDVVKCSMVFQSMEEPLFLEVHIYKLDVATQKKTKKERKKKKTNPKPTEQNKTKKGRSVYIHFTWSFQLLFDGSQRKNVKLAIWITLWWAAFWPDDKRVLITVLANAHALLSLDTSWMQRALITGTPTCLSAVFANELDIFWL